MGAIYKICSREAWREAEETGTFVGAPVDLQDGFIHFSTADQVMETARRHFHGQADLVLVTVLADALGEALRWEPSRGGDLFPHLYAALPVLAAVRVDALPVDGSGRHVFPALTEG